MSANPVTRGVNVEQMIFGLIDSAWTRDTTAEPVPWETWNARYFGSYVSAPYAPRHRAFWEWLASLRPGSAPPARVEVWPRGGGKSSTIELGIAWLGSQPHPARRFVLYVSETQAQADKHVSSIATMMEKVGLGRSVNAYGVARGWKRQELRTANGFNVVAFGLDTGVRGIKLDEYRPDLIVMDDIDGRHDTKATVDKKIETITQTILPSGSTDAAVVVVQNKVHKDSIVSQLANGTADFLHGRDVATVEPAIRDLEYIQTIDETGKVRYKITAGTPTWAGQDIATCEDQLNKWGTIAFLREAQQEVSDTEGGLWQQARDIDAFRVHLVPPLEYVTVGVDPNAGEGGDEAGIVVAGIAHQVFNPATGEWDWSPEVHGYVLADRTTAGGPHTWSTESVVAYHLHRASKLVAEVNNGGDMVAVTIETIPGAPTVEVVHASRGKLTRAEPVQALYEKGRIHHIGTFPELEAEMTGWKPGMPSPNRMDALVWAFTDLMLEGEASFQVVEDYMNKQLGRTNGRPRR